jgi:hypothetical protein
MIEEPNPNPSAAAPPAGAPDPAAAAAGAGAPPAESPKAKEGEQAPPAAAPKAKEGEQPAPAEISLTSPADALVSEERVAALLKEAKEQGLDQKGAQALLDREEAVLKDYVSTAEARLKAQSDGWLEKVKADPELGGEKLTATVALASRAVERFCSPELRGFLNETGLGNHHEMVRTFSRIGALLADDKFETGGRKTEDAADDPIARMGALYSKPAA